jgi:hypothetical protein
MTRGHPRNPPQLIVRPVASIRATLKLMPSEFWALAFCNGSLVMFTAKDVATAAWPWAVASACFAMVSALVLRHAWRKTCTARPA